MMLKGEFNFKATCEMIDSYFLSESVISLGL